MKGWVQKVQKAAQQQKKIFFCQNLINGCVNNKLEDITKYIKYY